MGFKNPLLKAGGKYSTYELLSLPNSRLKSEKKGEYSSACPKCGGDDRFQFWPDVGNYWCRQCGLRGFTLDAPDDMAEETLAEIMGSKITTKTPEVMSYKDYHLNLYHNEAARDYWERALGSKHSEAVMHFNLGYCENYKNLGPTMTIPVGYRGKVYVIKHRLLNPKGARYITEPKNRGALLLNLDEALKSKRVVITEGEKKAIRLWLEGYAAVSPTNGAEGFKEEWDVFFHGKEIFIIFDPDEAGKRSARKLSERLGGTVVELPDKVDDWINAGGTIQDVLGEP